MYDMSKKKKEKYNPSKHHTRQDLESIGCSEKFIKKFMKEIFSKK